MVTRLPGLMGVVSVLLLAGGRGCALGDTVPCQGGRTIRPCACAPGEVCAGYTCRQQASGGLVASSAADLCVAHANVTFGDQGGCGGRVVSPVWWRSPAKLPVERHIAYRSIAGGVNMALRGFEVSLTQPGERFEFPGAYSPSVRCPTTYLYDAAEAGQCELGKRSAANLWFPCAFQPVGACVPTVEKAHNQVFREVPSWRAHFRLWRPVCDGLGLDLKQCNQLELRRQLARRVLRLQPLARALVDDVIRNFTQRVQLPTRYAAFHIRRGDKCVGKSKEADCIPGARFLEDMLALQRKHKLEIDAIFVMSDDHLAVTEVRSQTKLPVITMTPVERRGRGFAAAKLEGGSTSAERSSLGVFADLWAEMEIAAKATALVVSHSSNVGRVIELLRDPGPNHPLAVSVDIAWHPG